MLIELIKKSEEKKWEYSNQVGGFTEIFQKFCQLFSFLQPYE